MVEIRYREMYNSDLKQKFIESKYKGDSQNVKANTFYKSQLIESDLQQDLNSMSIENLIRTIKSLDLSSYDSVKNETSLIKVYIDWCYENAYISSDFNGAYIIHNDDVLIWDMISKTHQTLWTKEDIDMMIEKIDDKRLKAVIQLTFEGVFGKESAELRNLKITDILEDGNTLRLIDEDGTSRELSVSDKAIQLIKEANEYMMCIDSSGEKRQLEPSEYVLKKAVITTTKGVRSPVKEDRLTNSQLLNRLKSYNTQYNTIKFTLTNIANSGMLYLYYKAFKKKNGKNFSMKNLSNLEALTNKEIENLLATRYSWTLQKNSKGTNFYNTGSMKTKLLNKINLSEVYKNYYGNAQDDALKITEETTINSPDLDKTKQEIEFEKLIQETLLNNAIPAEEEMNWLEKNKLTGDWGEKIALNYLSSVYDNVKSVAERTYLGYDIEVKQGIDTYGFEVKTSRNVPNFHLSLNELLTAASTLKNYNIFLIQINTRTNQIVGYILNNPVKLLELDVPTIVKSTESPYVIVAPNKFHFKISIDLLSEMNAIDLTPYIDEESKVNLNELLSVSVM